MVESHIVNFKDEGDAQKIDFFETDVHLGSYDYRFDFNDKKFFAKTPDGLLRIRIHTETRIDKVWLLLEDPEYKPIEIKNVSYTDAIIIGFAQALAILPGISRSGATISSALLLNVNN